MRVSVIAHACIMAIGHARIIAIMHACVVAMEHACNMASVHDNTCMYYSHVNVSIMIKICVCTYPTELLSEGLGGEALLSTAGGFRGRRPPNNVKKEIA